jgi:hypothetical protein
MKLQLKKSQLNNITTFIGLISGLSVALSSSGIIPEKNANLISGISTVLLGYFIQKPAKDSSSDTSA